MIKRARMRILGLVVSLLCLFSLKNAFSNAYLLPSPSSTSPRQKTVLSSPPFSFSKPRPLSLNNLSVHAANNASNNHHSHLTHRDRLRKLTGFSFTACRATLRGITGISLTALYASAVASTSSLVRNTMKVILSVFPTWFRYFLQPFLVIYYVPLFVIRATLGPSVKERRASHEHLVESWKQAVKAAEEAQHGGYWPVHVNEDEEIVAVLPPDPDADGSDVDIVDAVADSVEVSMREEGGEGLSEYE